MRRVQIVLAMECSPCKLPSQDDEQGQASHLQTETGQHHVNAGLKIFLVVRSARESTTDGLENETENVASDEGKGIRARPEARDMLAIDDNDAAEAEVDGCSEESRRDGEGNNVPEGLISRLKRYEERPSSMACQENTYIRNGPCENGLACICTLATYPMISKISPPSMAPMKPHVLYRMPSSTCGTIRKAKMPSKIALPAKVGIYLKWACSRVQVARVQSSSGIAGFGTPSIAKEDRV